MEDELTEELGKTWPLLNRANLNVVFSTFFTGNISSRFIDLLSFVFHTKK